MSQSRRMLQAGVMLMCSAAWCADDVDVNALAQRIKAVKAEGAGNAEASAASQRLSKLGPDVLPEVLRAIDDADPVAANWLRAAVDAIADRAVATGRGLPERELEAFVLDRSHAGRARRLAFEWLAKVDTTAPDRLISGMLDDPSVELRRDAVARELAAAQKLFDSGDRPAATAAYQKILPFARDRDQVDGIGKQLKSLGHEVNLTRHFGCVQQWRLIAPFNNSDKRGFDAAYPPEQKVDFAAEYDGKGTRAGWITHTTTDTFGVVDLNKVIGKHMGVVAYAAAELESPVERAVDIRMGTPNAVKIWLNGKLLFRRDEYHHGVSMDQYVAAGTLKRGRNTILIKVCQNEQTEEWAQNWMFQLRVCDSTGGGIAQQAKDETRTPKENAGTGGR